MKRAYDVLVSLAVRLFLVPATLARIALRRASPEELRQRLGGAGEREAGDSPRLLVHAVSVGEMAAAEPLLRAVLDRRPRLRVTLTSGTRDGLAAGERIRARHPAIEEVRWLPWDRAGAVGRWLRHIDPAAVIVVETEIWPNLFLACRDAGIPIAIASGRLRPRDVGRYRLARPLLREVLDAAVWIGAQDRGEAERFLAIGAPEHRVEVAGNLKNDASLPAALPDAPFGRWLRRSPAVVVAGSTHAPEERWILASAASLRGSLAGLRLVLAPRHPSRARSIARLAAAHGLRPVLWSSPPPAATDGDVLIVDELGHLPSIYRDADVAFLGGTLTPRGGHNPYEPASCGAPILAGPHTENFREAVGMLEAAGGVVRVPGPEGLQRALRLLLENQAERRRRGEAARRVCASARGSAMRHEAALAKILGEPALRVRPASVAST